MIPVRNIGRFVKKAIKQPAYAASVFQKRLKAYLSYKLFPGRSSYPEAFTLFVTHRCNLRCKMCGQWGDLGVTRKAESAEIKEELSFEAYRKFIDEVSGFKPNITLFGGEPLLYKDCLKLISYIKSKNMHCCMITNGTLLPRYAQDLVRLGLDELNISIDGPQDKHDAIRGVPGMFKQIKEGVDSVNEAKLKQGKKRPLVNIEFTITQYNYENMLEMLDVARDFQADSLNFHHLIFINQEMFDNHEKVFYPLFQSSSDAWKGFLLQGIENIGLERLNRYIAEILSRKVNFSVNVYPNLTAEETEKYYHDPAFIPQGYKKRCLSPWMVAYIFPNGDLRPCLNFAYSPGNIKEESFKRIWNNKKYLNFRGVLKGKGIFPVCTRCTELFRY
jgi:MoaA/NifB/PqqE/SkfB family radical SAM enzyme